jgi:hypothetical protein
MPGHVRRWRDVAAVLPWCRMSAVLPAAETDELAQCEQVIERGLKTFMEVGHALLRIRDGKLYRAAHPTFEDYCQARWGLGRSHAYRLIDASETVAALSPIGDTPAPVNEAQARELAPLRSEPELMTRAWQQAVAASGGKPTARMVGAVVDAIRRSARIAAHGGRGGGEPICTGCAICSEPGIICHYAPRTARAGLTRVVYIDAHGIAYDRYQEPGAAAEAADTYAGAVVRELQLPGGEPYTEVRQPPRSCGIRNCPACDGLGASIEKLFAGVLQMLEADAICRAAQAELEQIAAEWQQLLGGLAYIDRHSYYETAGYRSLREWIAAVPGHLAKVQAIITEGPHLAGITVPAGLADALRGAA